MSADLLGHDPAAITRQDKIMELKRELDMRLHVYGKTHPITKKQQRQIEILKLIIADYESGIIPG